MPPITNPRLLYFKGVLFLAAGLLAVTAILFEVRSWRVAALVAVSIWSFCRFYYFAFYVIEHYVDGRYRFTGLWDFAKHIARFKCIRNDS